MNQYVEECQREYSARVCSGNLKIRLSELC